MNFSDHYRSFSSHKRDFFSQNQSNLDEIKNLADSNSFEFLAKNHLLLEQEFEDLFRVLMQNGARREEFWLYCYYCCLMLKNYYTAYDKKEKINAYSQYAEQLQLICAGNAITNEKKRFMKSFGQRLAKDLQEFASTPFHADKISNWSAFLNIHRLHAVFCRLTLRGSISLAKDYQWLAKLEDLSGLHMNADTMIDNINAPTTLFNYLSVGLFATRFFMNLGLILKHVLLPTEEEQNTDWLSRLNNELYARHCVMLNDFVWAVVNGLSNFRETFNISAPVANWLTAGFLFFDFSLLIYRRHLAQEEYLVKKAQYLADKRFFNDEKKSLVCDEQLEQLEIAHQQMDASFVFNIAAAALLMGSFSSSLILATPVSAVICFGACTIGVAMYLSADSFGNYQAQSYILEQLALKDEDLTVGVESYERARNEFIGELVKNITLPYVFVSMLAVSLPLTICSILVYSAYQNGYFSNLSLGFTEPCAP